MKKLLVITINPLHNGPRLIREIDALKNDFKIVAVGSTPPHDAAIEFIHCNNIEPSIIDKVIRKLYYFIFKEPYLRLLPFQYIKVKKLMNTVQPDAVIVHTPNFIPYLLSIENRNYKVIFNAHEFHPLEFETDSHWLNTNGKLFFHIYSQYLRKVDLLINVCESIATRCFKEFGKASIVIPNAAIFADSIKPTKVSVDHIKLIHHGASIKEREIEKMIEAVLTLPSNYTLDLMLIPSDIHYHNQLLQNYAMKERIRFISPVPFDQIITFINQYDIGIFNLPPHNYNYKVALPNKLFEFVQARLCIIVSPSIEMKRFVEEYKLGIVSKDYSIEKFGDAIKSLTIANIEHYKEHAHQSAFELSSGRYQMLLLDQIKTALAMKNNHSMIGGTKVLLNKAEFMGIIPI